MYVNPNVSGGDVELQSLTSGQAIEGPNGGPAMVCSGVDLGDGTKLIVDLNNGTLTPLEPAHLVKRRDDLQVTSGAPDGGAPAAGGHAQGEAPPRGRTGTASVTAPATPAAAPAQRRPGNR